MKHQLNETMAKRRRGLVRLIARDLLGPIVGKMPKSSIESLEKLSYHPDVRRHIVDTVAITEAEMVKHDVDAAFPAFFRREAVFGKRNLYVLRDAVVSPHSGMAWIGKKIIEESVGSLRRIMDWGDLLHEPLLPVTELQLQEPVVVCHPAAGYYHWLLEVLPNLLFSIARFPDIRIVLSEDCPGYVTDGLITVLGPEAAARFIFCSTPIRVNTLVMPQYHTAPEFTSGQVLSLLQSEVKSKVVAGQAVIAGCGTGTKLFISRRKSRRRRLKGEDLLEERLRERDFTILHCENISFADQIRAFHQAEVVVATHGAGLSNLVWSQPPCEVIEIFPSNYILDCFAWLSFSLGLDYRYVICKTGHEIDEEAMNALLQLL